ncbi:co-chaperone GroES [Wenyingzhuangia sp. 2_MG-2023]|uniref:GroES family chaperonin n=1 Tax=Wenyingzhuangia sp. 2_MG-2023 TaxID=3062639 RepID=UPI0026E3B6B0|nr:co-chaperone GroES [Wenyingzhuangia sp. 2_MG-2023]MDO6737077.1 co-chaperone GroES [Wenyingzhuangia sp. 2_MG-2023]
MQLLRNLILVKPIKEENKTASGLIIPEGKAEKQNVGEVLLTGPKAEIVKVGDKVKHHPHTGISQVYEGEECLFLKEDDIIAVL